MNFNKIANYKTEIKRKEEIIMAVPEFICQILLMINAGSTITDSFLKAAKGCIRDDGKQQNYFNDCIIRIQSESQKSGVNIIYEFYLFARQTGIRELIRTAAFLYENLNKGTDIYLRLQELSDRLWEERKRLCMEKIRKAGIKMSFPLGIMLISLIIMTAAPAMINM